MVRLPPLSSRTDTLLPDPTLFRAPWGTDGAHAARATTVVMHPNNTAAYSTAEDGGLNFWTLPLAAQRVLPPHTDAVTRVVLSVDGNQVFTADRKSTRLNSSH